jgi:hypothetical protein
MAMYIVEGLQLRSMRRNFAETVADAVSDRDLDVMHRAPPAANVGFPKCVGFKLKKLIFL